MSIANDARSHSNSTIQLAGTPMSRMDWQHLQLQLVVVALLLGLFLHATTQSLHIMIKHP